MAYNSTIDKATDDILIYGNTAKDGSGTSYVPLLDTDGHTQVDVLTIAAGDNNIGNVDIASIAVGDNNIGNVDIVTLPGDVEADIDQIRDQIDLITPDIEEIRVDAEAIKTATELIDDAVYVDDADWTDNTSKHILVGGVYQSTPHTVTDGDVTPFLTDENGRLETTASIDTTGLATSANQTTIIGHVDGIEGLLGTIDADTGNIATSAALLDDTVTTLGTDTYSEATSKGITIGAVRRDADTTLVNTTNEFGPLQMDANGRLKVEAFSGETLPVSLTSTTITGDALTALQLIDDTVATLGTSTYSEATTKGNVIGAVRRDADTTLVDTTNEIGPLQMDANGRLKVEVFDSGDSHTVDNNGTFAVQATVAAAATSIAKAEDAAHSTGETGVFLLGVRTDTPNAARADTDLDYSAISTYRTGAIRTAIPEEDFAALGSNHVKKYYTNAGAVTDGIIWSPAAGKRWYVTDLIMQTSAAATVTLEDDKAGGDETVMKFELAANSGITHHFGTPLFSGEDAADLLVTTSAGNVYITVTGYEI